MKNWQKNLARGGAILGAGYAGQALGGVTWGVFAAVVVAIAMYIANRIDNKS